MMMGWPGPHSSHATWQGGAVEEVKDTGEILKGSPSLPEWSFLWIIRGNFLNGNHNYYCNGYLLMVIIIDKWQGVFFF